VIDPAVVERSEIAIATGAITGSIIGAEPARAEPVIALLSFFTKGSAQHECMDRVVEALRIVRERAPDLRIDGEFAGRRSVDGSRGPLQSARIDGRWAGQHAHLSRHPIWQHRREAGAATIGPFLRALAKLADDLSRGYSHNDIYGSAIVTALQSAHAPV